MTLNPELIEKPGFPIKVPGNGKKIYFRQELLIPSLMFSFFEKLLVFVLAHFLLTPFYNVPHTLTSFALFSIFFCLIHKGLKLNFRCERFSPVIRNAQTGYAILSLDSTHQPADNSPWHASERHGIDNA